MLLWQTRNQTSCLSFENTSDWKEWIIILKIIIIIIMIIIICTCKPDLLTTLVC